MGKFDDSVAHPMFFMVVDLFLFLVKSKVANQPLEKKLVRTVDMAAVGNGEYIYHG